MSAFLDSVERHILRHERNARKTKMPAEGRRHEIVTSNSPSYLPLIIGLAAGAFGLPRVPRRAYYRPNSCRMPLIYIGFFCRNITQPESDRV